MTTASQRDSSPVAGDFSERVRTNQQLLAAALKPRYDFIVCGAGSSGSVVARRLAENPDVSVLLVEAGGDDNVPAVMEASQWPNNLGSERDWGFRASPNPRINGRSIPMSMGKVLGGGSSINVMAWARGHKNDWDFFADEAGDPAWGYDAVLNIYRRIEDWHGPADPAYRGTGGPVFIEPAPEPSPLAPATLSAACSIGIPTFEHPNGRMMEGPGGAAICDIRARKGKRESLFRSYTYPVMDQPNLTVLTDALVTRVACDANRATGVEIAYRGTTLVIGAESEVVLSLGAIHTPKVLMHSGIGDEAELRSAGIPVRQHLPGVGRNFQDHVALRCVWQDRVPLPPSCLPTLWQQDERCREAYFNEFPGYYKTSDAGYKDEDGYVFVMGRTDDIINVAGHRLSTGGMEEILASHPDVAECAVLGIKDAIKGEVPCGFLVLKAGVTRSPMQIEKEIVALVRDKLGPVAAFKLAITVGRLPKTRSGKILRGTIKKIADGEPWTMPATIEDPKVLDEIADALKGRV